MDGARGAAAAAEAAAADASAQAEEMEALQEIYPSEVSVLRRPLAPRDADLGDAARATSAQGLAAVAAASGPAPALVALAAGAGAACLEVRLRGGTATHQSPDAARPVALKVHLPRAYPSLDPPVATLSGWPQQGAVADVVEELGQLFSPGEPVLFTWILHLRAKLDEMEEAAALVASSALAARETQQQAQQAQQEAAQNGPRFATQSRALAATIFSGETVTSHKSKFLAHVARVASVAEVAAVMSALREDKRLAKASHQMMAYRIELSDRPGRFAADNDDDGEHGAGSNLAHLLEILDVRGCVVVVTRWFGGVHLGPARFKIIKSCARDLLDAQGLLKPTDLPTRWG